MNCISTGHRYCIRLGGACACVVVGYSCINYFFAERFRTTSTGQLENIRWSWMTFADNIADGGRNIICLKTSQNSLIVNNNCWQFCWWCPEHQVTVALIYRNIQWSWIIFADNFADGAQKFSWLCGPLIREYSVIMNNIRWRYCCWWPNISWLWPLIRKYSVIMNNICWQCGCWWQEHQLTVAPDQEIFGDHE
jgi:hypothetical protein